MRKGFLLELGMLVFIFLLVVIVSVTGVITYKNLISLATGLKEGNKTNNKVSVLKQITADLYQTESNVRAFYFTRDSVYLKDNALVRDKVDKQLSVLMSYTNGRSLEKLQLDSIQTLVTSKFLLLDEWKSMEGDETITQELDKLPNKLNKNNDVSKPDDSAVKNKKKKKDELDKEHIKSEVEKVQREQTSQLRELGQQELQLNINNKIINDALTDIIARMERDESEILKQSNQAAIEKARTTNFIIASFCISSVLLLIAIAIILVRYIRKTNESNNALKDARIQAENLAQAKQNFLANMTHEIRTPINSIIGFTEQLDKSNLNTTQKEHVQIVKKSSMHLLKIVNDVLDYSKLQSGKFNFESIIFNPSDTVQEVIDILLPEAEAKGIKLKTAIIGSLPPFLLGDPFRLQQILLNILGNAIKFTGTGTVDLEIKADNNNGEGVLLNMAIRDTGIGIPANMVDKVFDDFEQVESNISKRFKGTGLGLSITKKLIENQNGHIHILSKEGKGTIVTVIIPFEVVKEKTKAEDLKEEGRITSSFLTGKRILVVDDEPFNRKLLKIILVQWGAAVEEAHDGENALSLLNNRLYDMVLMDVRMPGMSGIEITQKLRNHSDQKKKELVVIAITATNDQEKAKKCLDAGMNAFLSKPFTEKGLFEIINKTMNKESINNQDTMINTDELKKISNGDETFVKEMLELFIKGAREGLANIKNALHTNDRKAIMDAAHKIAPSCRHLGANKMLELVKDLEKRAGTDLTDDELARLVSGLEKEITITIDEVKKLLV